MDKPPKKSFISYAHKDNDFFEVFKEGLLSHLFTSDKYDFGGWEDSKIHIGSFWDNEIQDNLAECDFAILCISANFLNSKYIEAKEFRNLVENFPNTLIVPVYFNHCNIKAWDELSKRQFFKPPGEKYGKAADDDFSFCDLVELTPKDGRFIAIPYSKRELYFQDLVTKIEEALAAKPQKTVKKNPVITKAIPNYITTNYPYFEKDNFFGRDDLLKVIDDKIKTLDVPLLLSGIGGMGKTAVAVAYGKDKTYSTAYDDIAWVNVTENIFSNLFSTFHKHSAIPFEYSPDGDRVKDIANIMQLLKQVPGNNLLLIDNANEEADLQQFISAWKRHQPGWKCLVTTRCENNAYRNHLINIAEISLEAAEKLFKTHNYEGFDNYSFKLIYDYIGGHTFLIELLAKYGQESSTINSTAEILAHLKEEGIKALDRSVIAARGHQQETNNLVSAFVLGLYDPSALNEKEQDFMRYFSVLPATNIEFGKLVDLFGIQRSDEDGFDIQLNSFVKRGWLMHNANNFKCHQIIQKICKEKLQPNAENCGLLLSSLIYLFNNPNTSQVVPFFEIGLSIAGNISDIDFNLALMQMNLADRMTETGNLTDSFNVLTTAKNIFSELKENNMISLCLERMGTIYSMQGNMEVTMTCYKQNNTIEKELSEKNSGNVEYKDNLAVSYQKLGEIYQVQGNMEDAMKCYQQFNSIEKKLSQENPGNVEYKDNLAVSYQKLGEIYQAQENIEEAMKCYEQYNTIEKEIIEKSPDNVEYKDNLAVSYQKLGEIYQAQGNMAVALKCYQQFNSIEKDLSEKSPGNVKYKNNLAISFTKLASLPSAEEAKEYNTKAKEILENLVAQVTQNVEYKKNLERVNNALKDRE